MFPPDASSQATGPKVRAADTAAAKQLCTCLGPQHTVRGDPLKVKDPAPDFFKSWNVLQSFVHISNHCKLDFLVLNITDRKGAQTHPC